MTFCILCCSRKYPHFPPPSPPPPPSPHTRRKAFGSLRQIHVQSLMFLHKILKIKQKITFLFSDVAFEVGGDSGISFLVLQVHYGKVDKFNGEFSFFLCVLEYFLSSMFNYTLHMWYIYVRAITCISLLKASCDYWYIGFVLPWFWFG